MLHALADKVSTLIDKVHQLAKLVGALADMGIKVDCGNMEEKDSHCMLVDGGDDHHALNNFDDDDLSSNDSDIDGRGSDKSNNNLMSNFHGYMASPIMFLFCGIGRSSTYCALCAQGPHGDIGNDGQSDQFVPPPLSSNT